MEERLRFVARLLGGEKVAGLCREFGIANKIQPRKIRYNVTIQVGTWVERRDKQSKPADWRFTSEDVRIKLKRLYSILLNWLATRNLPRW